MNWQPITTPPQVDGDYYVRQPSYADFDLRQGRKFHHFDITTLSYTTAGGWNTYIDFSGNVSTKSQVQPDDYWEWAPAEQMSKSEFYSRLGREEI